MNPFLEACGAKGPLVLSVESPGNAGGETQAFDSPAILIGRDPRCDLRLTGREVAERHAYLQLVGGRLVCVGLGGRDGIYQGGRRCGVTDLTADQPVRIGPYRVRLLSGIEGDDDAPAAPSGRPGLSLEVSHRGLRVTRSALPPGLSLAGSGSDCAVRLVDPAVATQHAGLVRTSAGALWVVDLLAPGGVRVNGRDVSYARVFPGDSVQLGHSVIRVRDGEMTGHHFAGVGEQEARPPFPAPISARAASVVPETPSPALPPSRPAVEPTPGPLTLISPAQPFAGYAALTSIVGPDGRGVEAVLADAMSTALGPLMDEFQAIRQGMADDYHQARVVLQDSAEVLRREQSAEVRRELERLRDLTRELQSLQAALERQSREAAARPVETPPSPAMTPRPAATALGGPAPSCGEAPSPTGRTTDESFHSNLTARISLRQDEQRSVWRRILGVFQSPAAVDKPAEGLG